MSFALVSATRFVNPTPALLQRTSTRPKVAHARSARRSSARGVGGIALDRDAAYATCRENDLDDWSDDADGKETV